MKRLSTTTNLCVCQRAQSLRAWPFRKPCSSTFAGLSSCEFFAFVAYSPPAAVCRPLPHNLDASRHRTFLQLNLHNARVRRNHGRLPSNGFLESAPEHRARAHFFLKARLPIKR
jgi:hypothetical protein